MSASVVRPVATEECFEVRSSATGEAPWILEAAFYDELTAIKYAAELTDRFAVRCTKVVKAARS